MVWEVVGSAMAAYAAASAEERRQFGMAIADARPFRTSHGSSIEQVAREHRARMDAMHADTMRGAKVGTLLLMALLVTAAYGLAQLAGIA